MRFNIFLLVVTSSCLLAANVNGALYPSSPFETDFNNIFVENYANSISDIDRSLWDSLNDIIQKAMRITRGAACAVKEILLVNSAALTFINDIQNCLKSLNASPTITELLNNSQEITLICNDIFDINKNICDNFNDIEVRDNYETSRTCLKELSKRTIDLKNTIYAMLNKMPEDAEDCIKAAIEGLKEVLFGFPAQINKCVTLSV